MPVRMQINFSEELGEKVILLEYQWKYKVGLPLWNQYRIPQKAKTGTTSYDLSIVVLVIYAEESKSAISVYVCLLQHYSQ